MKTPPPPWQTMAVAPKDSIPLTLVLLCYPSFSDEGPANVVCQGAWCSVRKMWVAVYPTFYLRETSFVNGVVPQAIEVKMSFPEPIGWMPLPKPIPGKRERR